MIITTEVLDGTQKVLIIAKEQTLFLSKLKKHLREMKVDICVENHVPDNANEYDICVFVHYHDVILPAFKDIVSTKFLFIFFDDQETSQLFTSYCYEHNLKHMKVFNLQTFPEFYDKDLETIFWFSFSRTADIFLHIFHQPRTVGKRPHKKKKPATLDLRSLLKPKNLITIGIGSMIISQFLFVPALGFATWGHYQAYRSFQKGNMEKLQQESIGASRALKQSQSLFYFSQPVLHFFGIALPFENIFELNKAASAIMTEGPDIQKNASYLADTLFLKDKTNTEIQRAYSAKEELSQSVATIARELPILRTKIPSWTEELKAAHVRLEQAEQAVTAYQQFEPFLDGLLGKDSEKKYLLLFANNMELRPGGGFIGSFAIVHVSQYTVKDIRVYDVYDADGQLTTRVEPPTAISEYLQQPFWYLRDSAFSGDFPENAQQAQFFLDLQMNESDFDGVILLTTTAVKNILSAVDALYVSDYKETITADNFYLKAQLYAEAEFFPGSIQKKSFLASVMDSMIFGLADADAQELMAQLTESLNQKQIVMYSTDQKLQTFLDEKYWSGSMLKPECTITDEILCVPDYLYSLDANLGVNKANFFIQRPTKLEVRVDASGRITNKLSTTYINDSYEGVFPGGTYKNFIQLHLPANALIESVQIEGGEIPNIEETNFTYKTLGFYIEVPPQEQKTVTVTYTLPTTIVEGDGIYQLIVQKQVGSPNYDFVFSFDVPENMIITRHNLSPLAQDAEILYNTSVSSDKIFLIEFSKN